MSSKLETHSRTKEIEIGKAYFIGWDVGGWNCEKNRKSRDAIVILDKRGKPQGNPWRGSLRDDINAASTAREWVGKLFSRCGVPRPAPEGDASIVLAIDAPLGFSEAMQGLLTSSFRPGVIDKKRSENPYLYRETERHLFGIGWSPLSAVQDMIGSQATKAMHVLAKFGLRCEESRPIGVWTDDEGITAIETYPAVCAGVASVFNLIGSGMSETRSDREDAHICAAIAYLFATHREQLESPPAGTPRSEGWIWYPAGSTPSQPVA